MTIEADLFTTLGPLVSNRVKPVTFLLADGTLPVWPAIRYEFITDVPAISTCGNSETAADIRVQIDPVHTTFVGMRALKLNVIAAMRTFSPPAVLQDGGGEDYEAATKTYRARLDYIIHQSSP